MGRETALQLRVMFVLPVLSMPRHPPPQNEEDEREEQRGRDDRGGGADDDRLGERRGGWACGGEDVTHLAREAGRRWFRRVALQIRSDKLMKKIQRLTACDELQDRINEIKF